MVERKIEGQSQRDFIRNAVRRLVEMNPGSPARELIEANKTALGREYARAEREGAVRRDRNDHKLASDKYGEGLVNDGLQKGWLMLGRK